MNIFQHIAMDLKLEPRSSFKEQIDGQTEALAKKVVDALADRHGVMNYRGLTIDQEKIFSIPAATSHGRVEIPALFLVNRKDVPFTGPDDPNLNNIKKVQAFANSVADKFHMPHRKIKVVDRIVLQTYLQGFEIDPTFKKFVEAVKQTMDIVVISDGLDYVTHKTFAKENILHLEVYANNLIFLEGDRLKLNFPHANENCENGCGVCKCSIAKKRILPLFLVGDGKSDMCLAGKVDHVFAKGSLIKYCSEKEIPFAAIASFEDVLKVLKKKFPFLVSLNF